MLSSALIGCFTVRLISVAHTLNKSLLSDVNDGEIRHPTLCVTLDHKNSHKGLFYFESEMHTQSES